MTKINDLLFPKSIFKSLINKNDKTILIQNGVKEKLSQCAVLTTSFLGSVTSVKNNKIDTDMLKNILQGMGIEENVEG
ncbi:hypothetical protein BDAP_001363 [Binucleata daphniae]